MHCKSWLVTCEQAGLRQLVSWDLDTEWAEFVQFYLRVGGDWLECNQADSREEGVLLQYSNNGGISWGLIAEMYFTDFTKPRWDIRLLGLWIMSPLMSKYQMSSHFCGHRFVHYELPLAAKTPCTRFRWWQPLNSGEGYDQWAIDDIIILSEREKHVIPMANPTLPQVRCHTEVYKKHCHRPGEGVLFILKNHIVLFNSSLCWSRDFCPI